MRAARWRSHGVDTCIAASARPGRRRPRAASSSQRQRPHNPVTGRPAQQRSSSSRRQQCAAAAGPGDSSSPPPEDGEEGYEELQELSEARHVILEPNFLPAAADLREVFDSRFRDPRTISPERFLWDYWHVPGQYTLLRTQAHVYFPPPLYEALQDALLAYGEAQLGCRAITPIWMSYYIDGCSQELHTDSPHGPFAFVLSLTRWEGRPFTGGETTIVKTFVLDFWQNFEGGSGLERAQLMDSIAPHFNQLLVFDPRFPHGVAPVSGTKDPLQSRLVLHGWFTQPSPFFDGPLAEEEAEGALNQALEEAFEELAELPAVTGTLTLRLSVRGADGSVAGVAFLADTLVPLPPYERGEGGQIRAAVQHVLRDALLAADFPACDSGDTQITLPIVFD